MTRSLSPSQQALFAQEKLRLIYRETCLSLHLHRDFLFLIQDILLWRKVIISAAIVFLVESFFWWVTSGAKSFVWSVWLAILLCSLSPSLSLFLCFFLPSSPLSLPPLIPFRRLHTSDNTYITVISDVTFWLLLADGFWVVATRDRRVESRGGAGNPGRRSFLQNLRRQQKEMHFLSLEEAISRDAKSLELVTVLYHNNLCKVMYIIYSYTQVIMNLSIIRELKCLNLCLSEFTLLISYMYMCYVRFVDFSNVGHYDSYSMFFITITG